MSSSPGPAPAPVPAIVDYDSGFDYCAFWGNRDYEKWVERRTLHRLLPRLGRARWFADFGGGYGRNASHYREAADHAILVDYSVTQLTRASERLAAEVAAGQVHLLRADLAQLPLVDGAVDTAMVIRVLHHLTELEPALSEMSRVVARRWLVDVPIKHHALARLRSLRRGGWSELRRPEPLVTGSSDYPFRTFQLAAVRRCLGKAGFRSHSAASVNNFRRWDQLLSPALVSGLRPLVYAGELALQRLGRGWWGPSQFLLATRSRGGGVGLTSMPTDLPPQLAGLAQRTRCPACKRALRWSERAASCPGCELEYPRRLGYWDFVKPERGVTAPDPAGRLPT